MSLGLKFVPKLLSKRTPTEKMIQMFPVELCKKNTDRLFYGRCLLIEMYFCKDYDYGEKVDPNLSSIISEKCAVTPNFRFRPG